MEGLDEWSLLSYQSGLIITNRTNSTNSMNSTNNLVIINSIVLIGNQTFIRLILSGQHQIISLLTYLGRLLLSYTFSRILDDREGDWRKIGLNSGSKYSSGGWRKVKGFRVNFRACSLMEPFSLFRFPSSFYSLKVKYSN